MLAFGDRHPDLAYRHRPAAFGLLVDDGRIALVRVERDQGRTYHDLPGGAVDGDETEAQALVREFGEETGLLVEAGAEIVRARQTFLKSDGEPVENSGGIYLATLVAPRPALKIEDDHTLVWMPMREAITALRHDSHAWAVAKWLRLAR